MNSDVITTLTNLLTRFYYLFSSRLLGSLALISITSKVPREGICYSCNNPNKKHEFADYTL